MDRGPFRVYGINRSEKELSERKREVLGLWQSAQKQFSARDLSSSYSLAAKLRLPSDMFGF
jgi:hypothetical protein